VLAGSRVTHSLSPSAWVSGSGSRMSRRASPSRVTVNPAQQGQAWPLGPRVLRLGRPRGGVDVAPAAEALVKKPDFVQSLCCPASPQGQRRTDRGWNVHCEGAQAGSDHTQPPLLWREGPRRPGRGFAPEVPEQAGVGDSGNSSGNQHASLSHPGASGGQCHQPRPQTGPGGSYGRLGNQMCPWRGLWLLPPALCSPSLHSGLCSWTPSAAPWAAPKPGRAPWQQLWASRFQQPRSSGCTGGPGQHPPPPGQMPTGRGATGKPPPSPGSERCTPASGQITGLPGCRKGPASPRALQCCWPCCVRGPRALGGRGQRREPAVSMPCHERPGPVRPLCPRAKT